MSRVSGIVKWFNRQKGYGYIVPIQGDRREHFVHYSGIRSNGKAGHRNLYENDRVEFTPEESPKGPRATDVVVI